MASEGGTNAAAAATEGENRPRMGKPWDEEPGSTDRWKVEKVEPCSNEGALLETTSFSTTFAKDREEYLLEAWPIIKGALKEHGVSCKFSSSEGSMTVSTTSKTRDPYIVVKARDLIKLLSRSVPVHQAIKILNDDMTCDIIKIGDLIRNRKRFAERRHRLLGPNMSTLKAIENLTGCYILVQGNTVAAMGSLDGRGLKQVRRITEDCMNNIKNPVDHIQELKNERELAKKPALANESWGRILPKYEKENIKLKKKPYTPYPSPQRPSKIDFELESGKYSPSDKKKSAKKLPEKPDKQSKKADENKRKREAASIPPKENTAGPSESAMTTSGNNEVAMAAMSSKRKAKKECRKGGSQENVRTKKLYVSRPRKKHKSSDPE